MSNCLYILVCFVLFHKYVNKRQAACLSARRENQICILYQMVTRPPLCFTCIRTPTYGTSYYYYDSRTILGDAVESRRLRGEEKENQVLRSTEHVQNIYMARLQYRTDCVFEIQKKSWAIIILSFVCHIQVTFNQFGQDIVQLQVESYLVLTRILQTFQPKRNPLSSLGSVYYF